MLNHNSSASNYIESKKVRMQWMGALAVKPQSRGDLWDVQFWQSKYLSSSSTSRRCFFSGGLVSAKIISRLNIDLWSSMSRESSDVEAIT